MADQETTEEGTEDKPVQLKRYQVQLDGNRGVAVMKLSKEHAERMGDAVLGLADGEEPDEESQTQTKAKAPANKSKTASNK